MSPKAPETVQDVMSKIERVQQIRRQKFHLRDTHVTMSHGSGGKATHNLIEGVFAPAFSNAWLDRMEDSAVLPWGAPSALPNLAFTTDSYVVSPLIFSGGTIGTLAVHGTINDLAMSGAWPVALSAGFILEEGYPVADLRTVVQSMAEAARDAGVPIVTGDTKVVPKGKGDGMYINTAGIGRVPRGVSLGQDQVRAGDVILVSGDLGDHGVAVMLARDNMDIDADIASDSAPLHTLVQKLIEALGSSLHCLKDPTRGGVATTLNEIAMGAQLAMKLDEKSLPIKDSVKGVCELLGLDPLTIANEGKLLAFVDQESAAKALAIMRQHPLGHNACVIGEVLPEPAGMVFMHTDIGGTRVLDMLVGDPLPRIC